MNIFVQIDTLIELWVVSASCIHTHTCINITHTLELDATPATHTYDVCTWCVIARKIHNTKTWLYRWIRVYKQKQMLKLKTIAPLHIDWIEHILFDSRFLYSLLLLLPLTLSPSLSLISQLTPSVPLSSFNICLSNTWNGAYKAKQPMWYVDDIEP